MSSRVAAQATVLFKGGMTYMQSASKQIQCPMDGVPEIAFSGRSNVGKSSLINALSKTDAKTGALVSKTPGRTQKINFFAIGNTLRLVDLPGYGFAKAPSNKREHWNKATEEFLMQRNPQVLKMVYVLLDSRRGLLEIDVQWMDMLQHGDVDFKLCFTKTDKVNQTQLDACVNGGIGPSPH
ncbi:P-loop containing nucleoside triphosphate hydrolase protein [Baffinella frigidus]|nr:P-loop containing nucleoside triphosphate hydrolase protein [Cryptophyta sp. CCMP2293]